MTQNSINNSASSMTVDNITIDGNTISSTDTNGNIVLAPDGSGTVSVTTAPIVPSGDRADSLGSATNSWDNAYVDGLTFDDGTNVMANYSNSTFTPTLSFGGGTTGITYSTQTGNYFRIGDVIFIQLRINLTSKGSSTGVAAIGGLPFTSATDGAVQIFAAEGFDLNHTTGGLQFYGLVSQTSTSMEIRDCGSSVDAQLTDGEFQDTSRWSVTGYYWVS